mmetsp:Transcript_24363/g.51031  ORF Transcript_24363/g.51031 Transcript_24363/m.51031 type:complete len:631 (-) Transcript_24363:53-1945(-)
MPYMAGMRANLALSRSRSRNNSHHIDPIQHADTVPEPTPTDRHRPIDINKPTTISLAPSHSAQPMLKPLHHRRAAGGALPLTQPHNGSVIHGTRSKRRIGVEPVQHQRSTKSNGPLLVFRIIVIAIIILCLIWGYLIIKIASNVDYPQPSRSLARPYFETPNRRSRIGWMVRQELNHIRLQLRHVPLLDVEHMDSPVLVFTFNRADYLERTLWKIFLNHPAQSQHQAEKKLRNEGKDNLEKGMSGRLAGAPIIISQDGENLEVKAVIDTYRDLFEMKLGVPLYRIEHPRVTLKTTEFEEEWTSPYKLLAAHYGWAMEQVFSGVAYTHGDNHNRQTPSPPLPKRLIILEEDIEIADDFFSLMNSTADLLDSDDTLLAVSAFNDNGKEQHVADPKRLVRTDFFPGLGWMVSRNVWEGPASHPGTGLKVNWAPDGFWDDWLRENAQRRGRQIIRPEVSRTFHFGNMHGASDGENNDILNKIELEENDIHWEDQDLSYLSASLFAENYWKRVSGAKLVETVVEAKSYVAHSDVRLVYSNFEEFTRLAIELDIMQDEKAGVARTGYEGIVEIRYGRGNFFVYLTPPCVLTGKDKPEHFGTKPWKEYSKEALMKELGIESVQIDDRPPLNFDWDWR